VILAQNQQKKLKESMKSEKIQQIKFIEICAKNQ